MSLAVLLTDPSPHLRQLVLKVLLGYAPDHPEVSELEELKADDPPVKALFALQEIDGSWKRISPSGAGAMEKIEATSQVLKQLAFLGYTCAHPVVKRGAEFLFGRQKKDGSWPLTRYTTMEENTARYTMIPLQTALPLHALAACGLAADSRAEAAYTWLLQEQLPDGTWPTGKVGGVYGGVGGYRKMPQSRWGCRTNSTEVLCCLAQHPVRKNSGEAVRLLDLLLGRETKDRYTLGYEAARLAGIEPVSGYLTYHARFDPGLVLELCGRIGAGLSDARVKALVDFIKKAQGAYGLWDYLPNPLASRWVTFNLLTSLAKIGDREEWVSFVPRMHFQSYPGRKKRY